MAPAVDTFDKQAVETRPLLVRNEKVRDRGELEHGFQWWEQWKNTHSFWHLQKLPNLFYGKLFIENFDWEIFVNVIATTWARFSVEKLICVQNICNGKNSTFDSPYKTDMPLKGPITLKPPYNFSELYQSSIVLAE